MIEVNAGSVAVFFICLAVAGGGGFWLRGLLMASKDDWHAGICPVRCSKRQTISELMANRLMQIGYRYMITKNKDTIKDLTPPAKEDLKPFIVNGRDEQGNPVEETLAVPKIKTGRIGDARGQICGGCSKFNDCGKYLQLKFGEMAVECDCFDAIPKGSHVDETI